jgi:hypothetical protein
MLSEPAPFLCDPLIKKPSGTTHKIHDHNDYPPNHIPHKKHTVSYVTSPTLISEPPTFLTRGGGGTRVLLQGVPAFYDENDDNNDDVDDGAITTKLHEDVVIITLQRALRGSPPARWSVVWSQGLAGGEYYSAASSGPTCGWC